MHETKEDIAFLQALVDRSHTHASRHLRAIWTDEKKIPAQELPALMEGVQLLALATVTTT